MGIRPLEKAGVGAPGVDFSQGGKRAGRFSNAAGQCAVFLLRSALSNRHQSKLLGAEFSKSCCFPSSEDMLPRYLANGEDRRMSDLPLEREGVVALRQPRRATDELHSTALSDLRLNDVGHEEDPEPGLPEHIRQRSVVELGDAVSESPWIARSSILRTPTATDETSTNDAGSR